jgi:hypothetical protein
MQNPKPCCALRASALAVDRDFPIQPRVIYDAIYDLIARNRYRMSPILEGVLAPLTAIRNGIAGVRPWNVCQCSVCRPMSWKELLQLRRTRMQITNAYGVNVHSPRPGRN